MVIKKVFEGVFDEEVHSDFLKFSRGEFKDKYLIEAKKQKDKIVIKTSAEFGNFFVRKCLAGQDRLGVKGVIIATFDLSDEISFDLKKVSNFQGIRKHEVDAEVDAGEVLGLIEKFPRCFFALSFKTSDCELKIKPKAPKSGKPGKKSEEGVKADFCTLKTSNMDIVRGVLFDVSDNWKEVKVNHTIVVEDIVYPADMKGMKPEEVREKSKRKGRVVRKVEVDGKSSEKEASFVA